jgi:hypothetical protein
MQFYLASYYFIPLRSKYSPQHPVLKLPQAVFFPQCEKSISHNMKTTDVTVLYTCILVYITDGNISCSEVNLKRNITSSGKN